MTITTLQVRTLHINLDNAEGTAPSQPAVQRPSTAVWCVFSLMHVKT